MSIISLRVPEEELNIFKSYAKHNNTTLSEIIRTTMIEKIEAEYDLQVFADYEAEKAAGTLKTRPISELWKEIDLWFINWLQLINLTKPLRNWIGKLKR